VGGRVTRQQALGLLTWRADTEHTPCWRRGARAVEQGGVSSGYGETRTGVAVIRERQHRFKTDPLPQVNRLHPSLAWNELGMFFVQRVLPALCLGAGVCVLIYGLAAGNRGAVGGGVLLAVTAVPMLSGLSRSMGQATGRATRRIVDRSEGVEDDRQRSTRI
jgi:hypothetical protein